RSQFNPVQFTPHLFPSHLTRVSIYNKNTNQFQFTQPPIIPHIIFPHHINPTSPKTHSPFLHPIEEPTLTLDPQTIFLPHPFFLMATQNP
ncbi:AAA family ATPase, partial [Bacillus pumilus]|uniref:AAA family ATPase n=1 Tax=Bacillus pumilus TaxID=1408 RepID=UPI0016426F70